MTRAARLAADRDSIRARNDLDTFIAKFSPDVAATIRLARAWMRLRLPGAIEFVYDNAYALVIGYGPNDRPSDALFSIAAYSDHVSIVFIWGATLEDPQELLHGDGNQVRHVRLDGAAMLNSRPFRALVTAAVEDSDVRFTRSNPIRTVVRVVSKHQRPRRPRRAD